MSKTARKIRAIVIMLSIGLMIGMFVGCQNSSQDEIDTANYIKELVVMNTKLNESNRILKTKLGIAKALLGSRSSLPSIFMEASFIAGIDPYDLLAIGWKESNNNHYWPSGKIKRGRSGEVGIMQIMKFHMKDYGNIFDQRINIIASAKILKGYIQRLGYRTGIGAYNGGPGRPNLVYANIILWKSNQFKKGERQ